MFEGISFIKPDIPFVKEFTGRNPAPMFRKKFWLEDVENAELSVCGLGFGYYYINGKPVSGDLFTAPVSDYHKTLWYNVYDVTGLLEKGENCIAVWCGNGWYNEEFETAWKHNEAAWRDVPKFILSLKIGDQVTVKSDGTWKCQPDSAIWFNGLRSGEYFDGRAYDEAWNTADYDDSSWGMAVEDAIPPKGVFRECLCEPVRECGVLSYKEVIQTGENKFVYDFGQNMSGYIRLTISGDEGRMITVRYSEQLKEDGSRELNGTDQYVHQTEFMVDRFVCSGRETVWSPKFAYHGFRYAEVEGLASSDEALVQAVFVHQDIEMRTEFECSEELLNRMFRAGLMSTYSNMFYAITDCPTREKLAWANDAQSSTEQILTDFKAEHLLNKWLQDIKDAMREDGALPGIIPTNGWGYHWGNGPVSDGILFEIPWRIYLHTGNAKPLIESREWFDRYFAFLDNMRGEDGFLWFGLPDWACPGREPLEEYRGLINGALEYEFYQIAALAAKLVGAEKGTYYAERADKLKKLIMDTYLTCEGECAIDHQTTVAFMIYFGMYEDREPLKKQLMRLIEAADFHHNCGMAGLRRLYEALNQCGLQEYAYRILTAEGYPGYRTWFDRDATTLWECWDYQMKSDSKNHHMYSDFMSWMVKTILGIHQKSDSVGFAAVNVEPYFFEDLTYAKGSCDTLGGKIGISWEKKTGGVQVDIQVPEQMEATFRGEKLQPGHNSFWVKGE